MDGSQRDDATPVEVTRDSIDENPPEYTERQDDIDPTEASETVPKLPNSSNENIATGPTLSNESIATLPGSSNESIVQVRNPMGAPVGLSNDVKAGTQQTSTALTEPDKPGGFISQEKWILPPESRRWIKTFRFIGKFEILLGIYFLIFGITSVIISFMIYERANIYGYAGAAGLGILLMISGSAKVCGSRYQGNSAGKLVFSFLSFLGAGAVAGWCIYYIMINEFSTLTTVVAVVAAITALLCLLHVCCYVYGRDIQLIPDHVIVHTNIRTGERFFEKVVTPEIERRRVDSVQEDCRVHPLQETPQSSYSNYPAIPMSNLSRTTSMKTVPNQFIERTNHDLPQQYNTVHRHPLTMQQHRRHEMQHANSEFNFQQPRTQMAYAQEGYATNPRRVVTRAMTEVDFSNKTQSRNHQYAQSEIGQPRAITEVDFPRARPNQGYAQSEFGQSRALTEVDYSQPTSVAGYAQSEFGQARPNDIGYSNFNQEQRMGYAQYEAGQSRLVNEVDYAQGGTTPSRQYIQNGMTQPATISRYPQPMTEVNSQVSLSHSSHPGYPVSDPRNQTAMSIVDYSVTMQRQMHPQAQMGYRTGPANMQYQQAPSEAGLSYAPSEPGYPQNQSGRISPRLALAARQMQMMEAARQESLHRTRLAEGAPQHQQYMVATRPGHH